MMAPRQEAMLDAIIDQHRQNIPSDVFPFSWYKAQQYLDKNGNSVKFGIDPLIDHINLLRELTEIGAIKMQIIPIEKYSKVPIDPEDPKWQEFLIPIDNNYCICDIFMNNKDAYRAKYNLCRRYEAQLIFDDDGCTLFHIRIKKDGDYYFRQLREDGYPYKILKYAIEQRETGKEEPITRQELIKHGKMRNNQPSVRNLFKDQPIIRKVLSPFVDIWPGGIKFKGTVASISESTREQIQHYSKKIEDY